MGETESRYRVQSIRFNVACVVLMVLYLATMVIADDYKRRADDLREARLDAAQPEEEQNHG